MSLESMMDDDRDEVVMVSSQSEALEVSKYDEEVYLDEVMDDIDDCDEKTFHLNHNHLNL